ncbi:spermidine synthase [Halobacteriaceae archaeon GCM10025711]
MSRSTSPWSSLPSLTAVEVAVLVSGVSSMGLEIVAGRLVAPEFGSSIYTWGSIIGVFLTALGLGYAVGGRRAPERASSTAIVSILSQAAVYVAFLLFAGDAILRVTDALPLPARFAALVPVTILFGPPTFLLGFISPYAAELAGDVSTGEASGRVYALGTIGSIVGAFGTTFFLIPNFDITTIELGFGVLLVAGALHTALRLRRQAVVRAGLALTVLLASFTVTVYGVPTADGTVYETPTPYQELRVADDDGVRTLYLGGAPHSAMDLDQPHRYVFDYTRYFHLPLLFQDEIDVDRVLFIGGGGFSGPKRFVHEYPNATVDVVEIDPEVIDAAKEYFAVNESDRLRIHNEDGREFVENSDTKYDVIVLDAYRKDRVPFHLTTLEFMESLEAHLDEDGVMVANVISGESGPGSEFYRAELKTMQAAFPQVYSFPTSDTPFLKNIELVATKQSGVVTRAELRERNAERDIGIDLSAEVEQYTAASEVPTDDVPVLTDDRAPVDKLLDPQLGRRYVLERSEDNGTTTPQDGLRAPA